MPLFPKLRSGHQILVLFLAVWGVAFIYFEHVVPRTSASHCSWAPVSSPKGVSNNERVKSGAVDNRIVSRASNDQQGPQTNVLLVADPQLIDNHTYPGRNRLLLKLSKHTVDVYIKQNYRALVNSLNPDYIMFLGDYLDNGRLLQDAYYEKEFVRFERIFNRWSKYVRGTNWFTNVPGNHDVGFGDGVKPGLQKRFLAHFGSPNHAQEINGVEFVQLDTPSYLSTKKDVNADASRFVEMLPPPRMPRVLLSHVPLHRNVDKNPCGPLRESKHFLQNAGYQYQLALSPEVTQTLLKQVQPSLIFSGDDHDYCDVVHPGNAREITVKSISMAMGIKYPAVQLLSYSASGLNLAYDTHICYLPVPYVDVFAYVVLAVASGLFLLAWSIKQRSSRYNYSILPSWDENTNAILMDSPALMSQKVSNFLKEHDDLVGSKAHSALVVPLSNYTFTAQSASDKTFKKINKVRRMVRQFFRKWNLGTFFKHSALLGCLVIVLYNMIIWTV